MKSFIFKGDAKSYFGIWISNLFLTIITVGIFSAWAKVRRNRFFYENTLCFDDNLNYHATGWKILKGRLIALFVIVVISTINQHSPTVGGIITSLFILFILPYAFNKSMKFNLRMTTYRNISFNWTGQYGGSFLILFIWPLISILSLGTLIPFSARAIREYYFNSIRFGTRKFACKTAIKPYYIALFYSLIPLLGLVVIIFLGGFMFNYAFAQTAPQQPSMFASFIPLFVIYGAIVFIYPIFKAITRNIILNSLKIDNVVSFNSSVKPMKIVWIIFSNFLAITFSLFLLLPWAQVRYYKYLCKNTSAESKNNLNSFIDEEKKRVSAIGEEFSDLYDADVSI